MLEFQLVVTIGMPSWSLIPGTTEDISTSVGFEVKHKSSMLFILLGVLVLPCSQYGTNNYICYNELHGGRMSLLYHI